ncbi:LDH2 family malate/lactate/ureidoglycolate dehydrogenase [Breoghania corrubedonensis]|uniref:LDH2 family malate/lactate/ureidoglycolate dehydrogenase n=1 Tax=Breoghania corrubedonensis TaxID=665038 RepID=A0A2T5VH79_9HYPH|nr:Ldh family oxidoreductase [Breoghania corrubedonensis]PTW63094.1 LDH2 family malate/lactate/ureidoglycolate dehydrogenase [Breoghania corrubedonensis]
MSQTSRRVTPLAAADYCVDLLRHAGLPADDAATVAASLVRADLRGVNTHGITRMQVYMERLSGGLINARPNMTLTKPTPVVGHLDGDNALGFVTATRAMNEAMKMAETFGIGMVAANHSNHYGMAAAYILQAAEAGYISFAFSNAPAAMPAWGGRAALLGTSPFAAGAPAGGKTPFVVDFSPAITTRGAIRRAMRHGKPLAPGLALDSEGRPTTDPKAAFEGVVLPMGGPKGSGLAMLMDVMSGVFAGAGFAGGVGDLYGGAGPQDVGHFFLAMKPGLFMSSEEFQTRMETLVRTVHDQPRAEGFDEVLMPGERGARCEETYRREGIPFADEDIALLQETATTYGTAPLAVLP